MKKFLFLSLTVLFFAFSANAQSNTEAAKTSCTKSKTACTKSKTACTKSAKTADSSEAGEAQFAQAVLLSGENVNIRNCSTSGNEYRSYTCSKSGTNTTQTICSKSGKVTTVKTDKDGNELSTDVAMLEEGQTVTKEAKTANPAATKAACSKSASKKCCSKTAGKSSCSKSKKAVLTTGDVNTVKE